MKFKCQQTGKCCSAPKDNYLFLTDGDVTAIEFASGKSRLEFSEHYDFKTTRFKRSGRFRVMKMNEDRRCPFLKGGHLCGIHDFKPVQCATWPFWPEIVADVEIQEAASQFCEGIGKGDELPIKEQNEKVLQQTRADMEY